MKEVIAYYRRSTEQGQQYSLEAQKLAVEDFCRENGLHIIATFQETCSGKSIHRPKLKQAIQLSNRKKIPIIVLRLDRLGRTASEVIDLALHHDIIIAEHGLQQYDRFAINLMPAFAEKERELISKRTKQALRVAKEKHGVKLGNPRLHIAQKNSIQRRKRDAHAFAMQLQPLFHNCRHLSNVQFAKSLNAWNIPTRYGGKWFPKTVWRIRKRLVEAP